MTTYFVTGTDTDVGKTVASALLTRQLNAFYWKPIQSGTEEGYDRLSIQRYAGIKADKILPSVYEFKAPLSPHEAAALEGRRIDPAQLVCPPVSGDVVIEGAGGLMVPLNEDTLLIDVIERLCDEVIVVARTTLGTINHTLLSLMCLRARGLKVKGVILSGPARPNNAAAITHYGQVPVLGWIPYQEDGSFQDLKRDLFNL